MSREALVRQIARRGRKTYMKTTDNYTNVLNLAKKKFIDEFDGGGLQTMKDKHLTALS